MTCVLSPVITSPCCTSISNIPLARLRSLSTGTELLPSGNSDRSRGAYQNEGCPLGRMTGSPVQFRLANREHRIRGRASLSKLLIEVGTVRGGGFVFNSPERNKHGVCSRRQKCMWQSDQSFAANALSQPGLARRKRHELR